jgi:signal transduction histidine kinase
MTGRGLGLWIAYSATVMVGGDLSIESEAGRGTTVSFLLPTVVESVGK